MTDRHQLPTSHGSIVVEEAGRGDLPVFLIHGNSLSREVFRKQLGGALVRKHRLVALDLPGHGDSGDALDPSRTYTRPGLADAAIEVLNLLGLRKVVVVGWSLGGHIALEMASQFSGIKGLLISGAPPVSRHNMSEGFIPAPHMRLASQQNVDQHSLVENCPVPLTVVSGAEDRFVNLDYFDVPKYANLWQGRCHRLPGLKHAPFCEAPDVFDEFLGRCTDDVAAQ